ncbi:MAG: hypothetical protein QF701_15075, partial [Nitrospinota bacterium]|nr:hypothetical protein [Nitrospinota bacterium]
MEFRLKGPVPDTYRRLIRNSPRPRSTAGSASCRLAERGKFQIEGRAVRQGTGGEVARGEVP